MKNNDIMKIYFKSDKDIHAFFILPNTNLQFHCMRLVQKWILLIKSNFMKQKAKNNKIIIKIPSSGEAFPGGRCSLPACTWFQWNPSGAEDVFVFIIPI